MVGQMISSFTRNDGEAQSNRAVRFRRDPRGGRGRTRADAAAAFRFVGAARHAPQPARRPRASLHRRRRSAQPQRRRRSPPPPPARAQPPQAPPPQAQPADDDTIDDPKVLRRLGTRISVPPPPKPSPAAVPAPAPAAPPPSRRHRRRRRPRPSRRCSRRRRRRRSRPAAWRRSSAPYTPAVEAPFEPTLPRLKLGLRRFEFVQIGASDSADGVAAPETFNSFSVDVYPVSRTIRIGLTSAFGWQSGTWLDERRLLRDAVACRSAPSTETSAASSRSPRAFAGVGYMRRLQFDRTIPTAFWQFGVDAGVGGLRRARRLPQLRDRLPAPGQRLREAAAVHQRLRRHLVVQDRHRDLSVRAAERSHVWL